MMRRTLPMFKKLIIELQSNCNRDCFFCSRRWDKSGKRLGPDGKRIIRSMPTESALRILDQASSMGFRGYTTFHLFSEPFLDKRIIEMAREAEKRGLRPYEHTNGDVLKHNDALCKAAAEVFEYIVVGLYDYENESELAEEKRFWRQKLQGTRVLFSEVGKVTPRTLTPYDPRMAENKKTYPGCFCQEPLLRLIVQYDGTIAFCCEDMKDDFGFGSAFDASIEEIWYSERHVRIVKDLKQGLRGKYPLCAGCPIPPIHHTGLPRIARGLRRRLTSLIKKPRGAG